MAGVALQLLVMEDVIFSDPTRGSRYDFPFSRPGTTTFVLLIKPISKKIITAGLRINKH